MNLGTLTAVAAQFAGDIQQNRYTGLYTQALNLAQQQFALDTRCLWKDWPSTVVVAGQASYALPSDFSFEKTVACNGIPLDPVKRSDLLRDNPTSRWDIITGTPTMYNIDPDIAKNQVLLFPIPTASDAGKDLVLTYYAVPSDMVAASDVPLNSTALLAQYHLGLAAWAGWYLMTAEAATEEIGAKRRALLSIYNDCATQCADHFRNTFSEPLRMRGGR